MHKMHRRELFCVEFLQTGSPGTCQLLLNHQQERDILTSENSLGSVQSS